MGCVEAIQTPFAARCRERRSNSVDQDFDFLLAFTLRAVFLAVDLTADFLAVFFEEPADVFDFFPPLKTLSQP